MAMGVTPVHISSATEGRQYALCSPTLEEGVRGSKSMVDLAAAGGEPLKSRRAQPAHPSHTKASPHLSSPNCRTQGQQQQQQQARTVHSLSHSLSSIALDKDPLSNRAAAEDAQAALFQSNPQADRALFRATDI